MTDWEKFCATLDVHTDDSVAATPNSGEPDISPADYFESKSPEEKERFIEFQRSLNPNYDFAEDMASLRKTFG